ncbi:MULTISPECIES: glycine C-acetyltransferase [Actinomyces]|uniref:2-amino-3-ketobutyrate coenzyme A ligase n=1 Tax=Actinomyces respiraculi TaxID=2744574 RepID=A0A7T0PW89_9ACTO|nr:MULTISPECIES: glycine C-acetyltransferase [Actinomyces]QPL05469.1 glycine C-acetyltransferase [Actinomyces respiraculi]
MFAFKQEISEELAAIESAGLYKREREITSAQGSEIETAEGPALNFCANNYLGLADDSRVRDAAHEALDQWGFGMSSVRFICGTQSPHRELERELASWLGTEDAILFSSCFDANGAIFDVLLRAGDAIISDELNHASIIDGVRLCKATRYRYRNADMEDLRTQLEAAKAAGAPRIMIVTDGVFSMDGSYAPLPEIVALAEEYGALVMVDDSHATGFVGASGAGTPELFGVTVDVLSGTLGKALGGASGGYIAGPQEIVDLLRQRARPYLFSNTVAPSVVGGSLRAVRIARHADESRAVLARNAELFRSLMEQAGFTLLPGSHAIVPVMFPGMQGAVLAGRVADRMLELGVYVIAFSYPVVPRGRARIRVQLSAAHTEEDVRRCVAAFTQARDEVLHR